MKNKEFLHFLGMIFESYFYKKKSSKKWTKETDSLIKMIDVQKSSFGQKFYINYGIIIKSLSLQNLKMHFFYSLSSTNIQENQEINTLLDLDVNIPIEERNNKLKHYIKINLLKKLGSLETEHDLLNELKSKKNLNDVPLIVKRHFNLDS